MKNKGVKGYSPRWIKSLKELGLKPVMELIEVASDENWKEREKHHIRFMRLIGCRLTNLTDGGEGQSGRKIPDEVKRKIVETRRKNNNFNVITPEWHQKLTAAKKKKVAEKGSLHTEEQKRKWSIERSVPYSEVRKLQQANAIEKMRERNRLGKKQVVQMDREGNEIKIYPSLTEAAKEFNTTISNIWLVIKGKNPTAKGFKWKYVNN